MARVCHVDLQQAGLVQGCHIWWRAMVLAHWRAYR